MSLRLGVNIDHIATLRNARGTAHPDPLRGARLALDAGADIITAHLREDRRHIRDADMRALKDAGLPLNMEMAVTEEMLGIALRLRPRAVCLVPERRQELTTEGGLDVRAGGRPLAESIARLKDAGIQVAPFIDPDAVQVDAAARAGAQAVEFHTGAYARDPGPAALRRLQEAARLAAALGLEVHAGHGLTYENVAPVAAISEMRELNIGHFLVGEAVFLGFAASIREMKSRMQAARGEGEIA